tara:strand:- start:482 stop:679 length:198 start_codon:yes stop_codon:yes gene_type:complete
MEKQEYKEMISDLISENSDLKSKLEIIWDTVRNNPNNMQLGKVIRTMYWDERDKSQDRQMDLFSG